MLENPFNSTTFRESTLPTTVLGGGNHDTIDQSALEDLCFEEQKQPVVISEIPDSKHSFKTA